MSIEVKFRGQKVGGQWLYVDLKKYCENDDDQELPEFLEYVLRNICQFTGIKDCNDKEIYCGDIFDIGQTVNGQSKFVIVDCIGGYDVRYAHDLQYKYQYDIKDLLSIEELEIIGNIHENPELL